MLSEFYNIEHTLRALTSDEKTLFHNFCNVHYSSHFKNEKLQKELDIEKLKYFFFECIKKRVSPQKSTIRLVNKILKITKIQKQPLQLTISQNYTQLKSIVDEIDMPEDNLSIIMIKILYLIENEIIHCGNIGKNIEFVKSISHMSNEDMEIREIIDLLENKRKIKLPVHRGRKQFQKQSSEPLPVLTTKIKNQIYNKILNKKQKIFEIEEEKIDDAQFDDIKFGEDDQIHCYFNFQYKTLECFKKYFDFIFKVKKASKGRIDDIIESSIFCLFDDYHCHFDVMFEKELPFNNIPFSYEQNEVIHMIQTSIVQYLVELKNHPHINEIVHYFINYLFDRDYVSKFIQHEIPFYFANIKGFLNLIGYNNDKEKLSQMFKVFKFQKTKKSNSRKLTYIENKGYDKLIDFDQDFYKNVSMKLDSDGINNFENMVEIDILCAKHKLKMYIRELYPKTWERKMRILESVDVITFKQFENSEYRDKYIKRIKEVEEEKEEVEKIKRINFNDILKEISIPIEKEEEKKEEVVIEKEVISKETSKELFSKQLKSIQIKFDVFNFKTKYGLNVDDDDKIKEKFEKIVYQMDENNRNSILINGLESNITSLEKLYNMTLDNEEKSRLKRKINQLKSQKSNYEGNMRNVDSNGYEYGVNFEKPLVSSGFITSNVIKTSNKMKKTMEIIDTIYKKKKVNFRLNSFVINLLSNFEYVHNNLYEQFSLFMNHKIDLILENYLLRHQKIIRNEFTNKDICNDFIRLTCIIFFILQNENSIDQFYKYLIIPNKNIYINKFITYENKIGQVLEEKENNLYIKFEDEVKILDKDLVKLITNLKGKDVQIIRGHYKGFLGTVYEQLGDNISMTLGTYGLSDVNSKANVTRLKKKISDVKICSYNIEPKSIHLIPKNKDNKDMYSIARFLYEQVTASNYGGERKNNFHEMYVKTLKHVNEIIFENESKREELKLKKHDENFMNIKREYERNGLIDLNLETSTFRTDIKNGIHILLDNSKNYINEDENERKFHNVELTKEEKEEQEKILKEKRISHLKFLSESLQQQISSLV